MHIDTKILRRYSKKVTDEDIFNDLKNVYKIKNVYEEYEGDSTAMWFLADMLKEDIDIKRANYKAYIEEGMDARILVELRKSAILPVVKSDYWFYDKHRECETVSDIKKLRAEYISLKAPGYLDYDWQYFAICRWYLRKYSNGLYFNMEHCFADGDMEKYKTAEEIRMDFLRNVGFRE